jgi:ribosomal protein S18 acetylase RimI-like enzyme
MSDITFRTATKDDLKAIVALLADDDIGEDHETALPAEYLHAFEAMEAEGYNKYLLAVMDGKIVGSLQLTFMPSLSHGAAKRAQIESARVRSDARGRNIGTALMKEAIRIARENGCKMIQLDSDKRRSRAHLFYRRLGFEQSHAGFKKAL